MLSRHFKSLLCSPQKRLGGGIAVESGTETNKKSAQFWAGDEIKPSSSPLLIETFDVPRLELYNSDTDGRTSKDVVDPLIRTATRLRDKAVTAYRETSRQLTDLATVLASPEAVPSAKAATQVEAEAKAPTSSTMSADSGPRLATVKPFDKANLEQKWESVKHKLPAWQTKIAEALQTIQDMITKRVSKKEDDCSK